MSTTFTTRGFKTLLLAGSVSAIALSVPAYAQDEGAKKEDDAIIVTGSRIQRADYENNSPTVTVDTDLLQKTSTAAIETSLNKLPQFTPAQTPSLGADIQPTATNTPGAATISLRGLGSNRNLVLLDGRRGTPANASGVIDISTIPSAAVQRIEVVSGGSSATYGADAVAGVTNFILKKDVNGLELDGQFGVSQHGDGKEYQLSGIMGSDFDDGRGNVSLAMSWNQRDASYRRDRSWYRDIWADPNVAGSQFFLDAPGVAFGFANLPDFNTVFSGANPAIPAFGTTVYFSPSGQAFTNTFGARGGVPFFDGPVDGYNYKIDATGALGKNNTNLQLVLPLTRYNFLARGNYEINDWIGVFGQAMFSHVHTETRNEPGPIVNGWAASVDPDGLDQDQLPDDLWTLLNSRTRAAQPGDDAYILPTDAVPNPVQPIVSGAGDPFTVNALLPFDRETFTDVMTYNLVAGLQGYIPGTDWNWDISVNHGVSSTYAKQTGVASLNRLRAVLAAKNFGEGFSYQNNGEYGGFGASTGTCTSGLNFFKPPAGGFSQDCLDAIRADLKNRSLTRQSIVEANLQGKIVDLPAGELRAAIGASYRDLHFKFDNDTLTTQGTSFQDQALGIYPSGDVDAGFDVKEVYGEVLVPILSDIPFIKNFGLELGGRISNYSTTGTSYTYKILGDWQVNDWLRFRGGYNRAERAPNIGELFLAAQQTFGFNVGGDLCSRANPGQYSANPVNGAAGADVEAACRALMRQAGPNAIANYYGPDRPGQTDNSTFGFAFPTTVGNANLSPEKADTWTAGVVFKSPFDTPALSRLRLTVDYYNISVKDAIGVQGVGIALRQCLDPALNPAISGAAASEGAADAAIANQFCANVPRNVDGGLGNVKVTYVNNGRFRVQGIDTGLDWSADVGPGTLGINSQFTYLLSFKSAELPTDPLYDYAGTQGPTGNGLNGGNYRWRVFTTLNYSIGDLMLGLQWQHLPSIKTATYASYKYMHEQWVKNGSQAGAEPMAPTTTGAPSYDIFYLNGSYALTDNVNIRFGVDNLFNKAPPRTGVNLANTSPATTGQLPGGAVGGAFYDDNGRRFYIGANVKF